MALIFLYICFGQAMSLPWRLGVGGQPGNQLPLPVLSACPLWCEPGTSQGRRLDSIALGTWGCRISIPQQLESREQLWNGCSRSRGGSNWKQLTWSEVFWPSSLWLIFNFLQLRSSKLFWLSQARIFSGPWTLSESMQCLWMQRAKETVRFFFSRHVLSESATFSPSSESSQLVIAVDRPLINAYVRFTMVLSRPRAVRFSLWWVTFFASGSWQRTTSRWQKSVETVRTATWNESPPPRPKTFRARKMPLRKLWGMAEEYFLYKRISQSDPIRLPKKSNQEGCQLEAKLPSCLPLAEDGFLRSEPSSWDLSQAPQAWDAPVPNSEFGGFHRLL